MSKYCISCGREIDESATFCPDCGARQNPEKQSSNPYQDNRSSSNNMSTIKILGYVSLGLAIAGVVFGGLFTEIAALVVSIIVLNSKEGSDKDARLFAKIALVISIILIVIMIAYLVLVGGFIFSQLGMINELEDTILQDIGSY